MSTPHLHIIMTAQEYILSTLHKIAEPIEHEDIGNTPLEEAIYAKVMSKKFRKVKADQTAVDITKKSYRSFCKK